MKIRVDLKTKVFSKETKVYLARAGKSGHLFNQVLEMQAIGPDLPELGLDLREGFNLDRNVETKIKRARALQRWLRTSEGRRGDQPASDLNDYRDAPKTSGYAQIEGIVNTYFSEMSAGDVVVIPNPSYFDEAIIADLMPIGLYPAVIPGTKRFEGYNFDGRKFASFKRVKMADLPRSVIDLAKAPTGLAQITNPAVKLRIFELGFPAFVFDDEFVARIHTTRRDFTPFDGNVLNALVNMVALNVDRLETDGEEADLLSLVEAAFVQVDNADLQVKININSPGNIAIHDRSIVPLVTSTVLAVLVALNFDSAVLAQGFELEVNNSLVDEALDLCSEPVSRLSESMLKMLEDHRFRQTCALLRETHADTGANVELEVEIIDEN